MYAAGVKILPSICFEITFPDLMRSADQSIGMLLTVTNDAWFGKSSAQAQHLQMAQMRAAEFNRPVLFVGNDGITAIIASNGTIAAMAPDHQAAVLTGRVQPMNGLTPWMYFGSDVTLFMLLGMLYLARRAKLAATKTDKLSANEIEQSQGLAKS
jgi:apolipoprotein N-acyltransferase